MNWTMVGVLATVLIAIGGGLAQLITSLVKTYFESLSKRMDAFEAGLTGHTAREEAYQDKMLGIMTAFRESLIRLEAGQQTFVSITTHLEALRTFDGKLTDCRHSVRNDLQPIISKIETKIENLRVKLEDHLAEE